jgi:hypothetical protein
LAYDWFRPQSRSGFGWTTSAISSWNKNEVTRVDIQASSAWQLIDLGYKEGSPIHSLFSYKYAGLNEQGIQQWYASDGRKVNMNNGNPQTMDIKSVVFSGQADPKHTFAVENRWSWNGFSLNVMMVYYGGHHMRAQAYQPLFGGYAATGPLENYYVNAWTPENTNTDVPGIGQHNNTQSFQGSVQNNTDIFAHNANFFKIRNIVLGYDLSRTVASKLGVNNLSLRFQIDNPMLWTKNDLGVDPETLGIRSPACYIFGLNIRF